MGMRKLEVYAPLRHRPDLLVVVHPRTGRKHVLGDGGPLSTEELQLVKPPAKSTGPQITYTDAEQAELDATQQALDQALEMVEEAKKAAYEAARRENQRDYEAARQIVERARQEEREARVAHNAARLRITRAARMRCDPPQFHEPAKATTSGFDKLRQAVRETLGAKS